MPRLAFWIFWGNKIAWYMIVIRYDWPVNWKNRQNLPWISQEMAKNTKEQPKKQKPNKLKIAKKWPKYHLDHENYAPIGATGKTPSWIPENIPKNVDKKAQNAIK